MQSFCPNNLPLKFDEAYFSNRMAMYCLQCFAVKLNVFNHSVAHTKSFYISHAVRYFFVKQNFIFGLDLGLAGPFRVHEFLVTFVKVLTYVYSTDDR